METNIFSVNDWIVSLEQTDNYNYIIDIHDETMRGVYHVTIVDIHSIQLFIEHFIKMIEGK